MFLKLSKADLTDSHRKMLVTPGIRGNIAECKIPHTRIDDGAAIQVCNSVSLWNVVVTFKYDFMIKR